MSKINNTTINAKPPPAKPLILFTSQWSLLYRMAVETEWIRHIDYFLKINIYETSSIKKHQSIIPEKIKEPVKIDRPCIWT
jgi:hypothetical protein